MRTNASGCREEQSGADALRSLGDWVGIVMALSFGKGSGNAKRAGTVTYCSPKFLELRERCYGDLHAGLSGNRTSVCFSCFCVPGTHRDVEEQTRRN